MARKEKKIPLILILVLAGVSSFYLYNLNVKEPHKVKIDREKRPAGEEVFLQAQSGTEAGHDVIRIPDRIVENIRGDASVGVKAFNEGDFHKAAIIFRLALKNNPDNDIIKNNLAHSIAQMGWNALEKGNPEEAKGNFTEALTFGDSVQFHKGLAYSEIKLGEFEEALARLEKISTDREAKELLKNTYFRLGSDAYANGYSVEALEYFNRFKLLDPTDERANEWIKTLSGQAAADEGLEKREGSHFTVKFEGGENTVTGDLIAILLEEAYYRVGGELGFYPEDRITAILYTKETFMDVTRSPSWAGAIYDGRIKMPVGGVTSRTSLLEKVIFHEYTHALVHRLSGGRAPVWLNEGLAQYFEEKKDIPYKFNIGGKASVLRRLEGSFMGLNANEASTAYALSLSATGYLIREFGIVSAKKILERLKDGDTMDNAFSSSVYLSYDGFEESWLGYLKRKG